MAKSNKIKCVSFLRPAQSVVCSKFLSLHFANLYNGSQHKALAIVFYAKHSIFGERHDRIDLFYELFGHTELHNEVLVVITLFFRPTSPLFLSCFHARIYVGLLGVAKYVKLYEILICFLI